MKAVILAAGLAKRLGELTKEIPKCLLKIDDSTTILDHQLKTLTKYGNLSFSDIFIVIGRKIDKLRFLEKKGINLIYNPRDEWNNIYSFYLIKDYVNTDFYLLNSDVIYHPEILKKLTNTDNSTYFVIDNGKKLGEEEMKVIIKDNRVLKFGKDIDPNNANGEYIGLARFNMNDAKIIFHRMKELIENNKVDIWYEQAINDVLDKIIAKPVYFKSYPWIEVDTKEDYEKGKEIFRLIKNDIQIC